MSYTLNAKKDGDNLQLAMTGFMSVIPFSFAGQNLKLDPSKSRTFARVIQSRFNGAEFPTATSDFANLAGFVDFQIRAANEDPLLDLTHHKVESIRSSQSIELAETLLVLQGDIHGNSKLSTHTIRLDGNAHYSNNQSENRYFSEVRLKNDNNDIMLKSSFAETDWTMAASSLFAFGPKTDESKIAQWLLGHAPNNWVGPVGQQLRPIAGNPLSELTLEDVRRNRSITFFGPNFVADGGTKGAIFFIQGGMTGLYPEMIKEIIKNCNNAGFEFPVRALQRCCDTQKRSSGDIVDEELLNTLFEGIYFDSINIQNIEGNANPIFL